MKLSFNRGDHLKELILEVAIKIARRGEGGLIVLGECKYQPLVKQEVPPFEVVHNPKLLESLTLIDGAVVIKQNGMLEAYGVKVQSNNILPNFGTRHSAGVSASMIKGTTAYVISEEDRKVRVFKDGKMIIQIDALEKNIEKKIPEINSLLEDIGLGTLLSVGASIALPALGLAIIPGIIVFGSASWLMKKIKDEIKGKN